MNRSEKNFREKPETPAQLLASLAGQCGVELKPSGYGRLIGLCPFHNEKTPSFVIYPEGRFYCFGCKEHGDAIDFIRKQQGNSL
jgi:DNA primase